MSEEPAVPLATAAAQLGITSEALRMRLKRGTARGEKRGTMWYVVLEAIRAAEQPTEQLHAPTEQTELVVQLRSEVTYLRGALEREQAASEQLRVLLQQRLTPQLAAPLEGTAVRAPESLEKPPAGTAVQISSTANNQPRRPWWKVW